MKRKIRNILLSVFLTITAACFAFACKSKNSETENVNFTAWTNTTDSVSYGATYYAETVAISDEGETYPITSVSVKNSSGEIVAVENGKFIASDLNGYTATYTLAVGENTFTKTVTITVIAAAPVISWGETSTTVYKDLEYTLPKIYVEDYIDGEIENYSVSLYKNTETGEVKQEVDLTSGSFTPTETGAYYLLVSAQNSNGIAGTQKIPFDVILSTPTLALSDTEAATFKNNAYTLPTCTTTDAVDGKGLAYEVDVYKAIATRYELQAENLSTNAFTPTQTGRYVFLYSVTNSHGVTATAKATLNVEDRADYDEFFETVGTEIVDVIKVDEDYTTDEIEARNDWEKINYNYNGQTAQTTYIQAGAEEIASFTGDYTGNAVRYNCTHGYAGAFRVNNTYTETELMVLAEKYTHVSVWLAYNAVSVAEPQPDKNGKTNICFGTWGGLLNNAENGGLGNLKPEGSGVWKKYLVKIDKYIELTMKNDGRFAELFQTDIFNLDKTKSFIYVGDVSFEYIEPTILTVTSDTAANIIRGADKGTYVAADADEIKDFAGDYTGDAVSIEVIGGNTAFLKTSYTAADINGFATKYGYTHVSMWIAVSQQVNVAKAATFYNKRTGTIWGSLKTVNTWLKYSLDIGSYAELISGGQVALIDFNTAGGKVYFGNVIFEKIDTKTPTLYKVYDTQSAASVEASISGVDDRFVNGDTLTDFTTADGLKTYTGDAVVKNWTSKQVSYTVSINSTAEEISAIAEENGYTQVSMWMAYDFDETSGYICSGGTTLHRKSSGASWGSLGASGKKIWKKYTVTVSDFVTLMGTGNEVLLLKIAQDTTTEAELTSGVRVYFGDIIFE